jgi:Na+/H+ antiporter NhaD/arsenite permease-like protein
LQPLPRGATNTKETAMKIAETQPRPRTLGFVSVLGGFLGLVFFWWVPMGILFSFCGLIAGLIGWLRSPQRPAAVGLLLWGVVLSLVVLGLDVFIAMSDLESLKIHAFR